MPQEMTREERFECFRENLPSVAPYLFSLADQLLNNADNSRWNVIIGDDAGARLPTWFCANVLKAAGYELPTHYVAGSRALTERLNPQVYEDYFSDIAKTIGTESLRPLLLTESIYEARTVHYLQDRLRPVSDVVEVGCVNILDPKKASPTYCGSKGELANYDVFYTFESIRPRSMLNRLAAMLSHRVPKGLLAKAPSRIRQQFTPQNNDLLGLHYTEDSPKPVMTETPSSITQLVYGEVSKLVHRYLVARRLG